MSQRHDCWKKKKIWRTFSCYCFQRMQVARSPFLCSAILTMLNSFLNVLVDSSNSWQLHILCLIIHGYYFNCFQQTFYVPIWYLTLKYNESFLYCCNLMPMTIFCFWYYSDYTTLLFIASLSCFSPIHHNFMQLFSFHVSSLKYLKHHNLSIILIHFICWSHCVWSQIYISQCICVVRDSVRKLFFLVIIAIKAIEAIGGEKKNNKQLKI